MGVNNRKYGWISSDKANSYYEINYYLVELFIV